MKCFNAHCKSQGFFGTESNYLERYCIQHSTHGMIHLGIAQEYSSVFARKYLPKSTPKHSSKSRMAKVPRKSRLTKSPSAQPKVSPISGHTIGQMAQQLEHARMINYTFDQINFNRKFGCGSPKPTIGSVAIPSAPRKLPPSSPLGTAQAPIVVDSDSEMESKPQAVASKSIDPDMSIYDEVAHRYLQTFNHSIDPSVATHPDMAIYSKTTMGCLPTFYWMYQARCTPLQSYLNPDQ